MVVLVNKWRVSSDHRLFACGPGIYRVLKDRVQPLRMAAMPCSEMETREEHQLIIRRLLVL